MSGVALEVMLALTRAFLAILSPRKKGLFLRHVVRETMRLSTSDLKGDAGRRADRRDAAAWLKAHVVDLL